MGGSKARGFRGSTHQDELEEGGLVDLDEFRVEGFVLLLLVAFALLLLRVVLAVLDHLLQDLGGNVGERDGRLGSGVCG